MQTVSSASLTCFRSESATECTATVWMPISLQVRSMRSAISPRLAITIFSNIRLSYMALGLVKSTGFSFGQDGGIELFIQQNSTIFNNGYSITNRVWPYSTGSPLSTRIAFMVPALSASIWLRSFMASMMQRVSPTLTLCPTSTKGEEPGEAAR